MKLVKEEIAAKTRLLNAQWKISPLAPPTSLYSAGLEEELSKTLQQEIDWEIMVDLLNKAGKWIYVELPHKVDPDEFSKWKSTLKGAHLAHYGGLIWMFELKEDAEWFTLKWS